MAAKLQEGIYYARNPPIGKYYASLFLSILAGSKPSEIVRTLSGLWSMYVLLKKGIVTGMNINRKHLRSGDLSVLIGFGQGVFALKDIVKKMPSAFSTSGALKPPDTNGGGVLLDGSAIRYSEDVNSNHALTDQIIVQFIANNEFATARGVVETWKFLRNEKEKNGGKEILAITRTYTGILSDDMRNWLGFHDGLSNSLSNRRLKIIAIEDSNALHLAEKWAVNGTFLAFLRIAFDIESWQGTDQHTQELIMGRDKISGCPLIGVDAKGIPIKDRRCPVPGTSEIIERGNETFRTHPPYGYQRYLPASIKDSILKLSHIGRSFEIDPSRPSKTEHSRIYRQGFNFFESIDQYPGFRVGLNFVSFQNEAEKILRILRYGFKSNGHLPSDQTFPSLEKFFRIRAAGMFFVPPHNPKSQFPGAEIFAERSHTR